MHKHTIDWYLQLNLTSDATHAQKRWTTAGAIAKSLPRRRVIELLRLFLFENTGAEFTKQFTDELVAIDPEFPITNNAQELRLMAGLVMATTFADVADQADAFALGLRAANFPNGRIQAIQPEILAEAEEYLRNKAGRLRGNGFAKDLAPDLLETLLARGKALSEADASGDEAKKSAALGPYRDSIPRAIASSHRELAKRINQIAEESALLWWVLAEHSEALNQPVSKVDVEAYALPAAAEAAQRTVILPPPPSIGPLLARALKPCKTPEKKLVLSDYVKSADSTWRAAQIKLVNVADCRDLSPLSAVLEKTEELGATAALKAVGKICPGIKGDLPLLPVQVSHQFFNEIVFHRSLGGLAE